MDEQLTFEFEQRPTIKGFPELRWTGKRPYRSTQYYLPHSYGSPMVRSRTAGSTRFSGETISRS